MSNEDRYYVHKRNSYLGNDLMWWRINGNGHSAKISEAEKFTKVAAMALDQRKYEVWPCEYIDSKTHLAVDSQYLEKDKAL